MQSLSRRIVGAWAPSDGNGRVAFIFDEGGRGRVTFVPQPIKGAPGGVVPPVPFAYTVLGNTISALPDNAKPATISVEWKSRDELIATVTGGAYPGNTGSHWISSGTWRRLR